MEIDKIIMAFDALGNYTRLKLFRLLVENSKEGLNQTELAQKMGDMPRTTLSFHLELLKNSQLCFAQKMGKNVVYTLRVYFSILISYFYYITLHFFRH